VKGPEPKPQTPPVADHPPEPKPAEWITLEIKRELLAAGKPTDSGKWSVEAGGVLKAKGGSGWLGADQDYDDLELKLEFRLGKDSNLIAMRKTAVNRVREEHAEAVKKWDWLRANTAKTRGIWFVARCLSQFFHSLAVYRTKKGRLFDHEDLDVYQVALQLVAWLESMLTKFSYSADLRAKLDKSITSQADGGGSRFQAEIQRQVWHAFCCRRQVESPFSG
jgi:hypothetical protein